MLQDNNHFELLIKTLKVACDSINEEIDGQIGSFNEVVTRVKSESVKQTSKNNLCTCGDVVSSYSRFEAPCGVANAALEEISGDVRTRLATVLEKFEAEIKCIS